MTSTTETTAGSHPDPAPGGAEVLRRACGDVVTLPGDRGYDDGRRAWNVAVPQQPAAVAVPRTVEDVRTVVRAAARSGMTVTTQTTGHAAASLGQHSLQNTVLIRTHELRGVHIDPANRLARVEAGVSWEEVVAAAAVHGLAALHGSAPDIGVAGYTLGGGLGWYARSHGLACNSLVGAEVVLDGGDVVRADARTSPDLFWALRGGGGNFGVVVALELELFPIPDVVAGMMLWEIDRAEDVVAAWAAWCADAPAAATTSLRALRFPPLPELPPFLSGRSLIVVDGAVQLPDDEAAALLAPLRALAPEMDTFARVPTAELLRMHMDPEQPTPSVGAGGVLAHLDDAAVAEFLTQAGPGAEAPFLVELRHLGGALATDSGSAEVGALAGIDGSHLLLAVDIAPTPEAAAAGQVRAEQLLDAFAPWSTGQPFLNLVERPVDPATAFGAQTWERLRQVRRQVDPHGRFLANHAIPL